MPQRRMMVSKKWFVLKDEKVLGPFTSSHILTEIEKGEWRDCRFWAKGKPSWMILTQFKSELEKENKEFPVNTTEEPQWRLLDGKTELGPMSYNKILEYLRSRPHFKNIFVMNDTEKVWKEVYQIDSLMEKLGVNRRVHPRVPVEGTLLVQDGFLKGQTGILTTLSQGGLGATGVTGFSIGEKFRGSFTSPNISAPIHFQAEVVFLSPQGNVGFKFTNLSTESLTLIIAYVKQFMLAHPEVDFRKIA